MHYSTPQCMYITFLVYLAKIVMTVLDVRNLLCILRMRLEILRSLGKCSQSVFRFAIANVNNSDYYCHLMCYSKLIFSFPNQNVLDQLPDCVNEKR